jgi:hypothetical protein
MRKYSNKTITYRLRELRNEYRRLTIKGHHGRAIALRRYIATLKALSGEVRNASR